MFHRPPQIDTPDEAMTPEQERIIAKFRRFSTISMLVMLLGVASVMGVIGYRMLRAKPLAEGAQTVLLPKGAKIVATAVAGDVVVVTLDIGGATEICTYDARTLAPAGTLRFAEQP